MLIILGGPGSGKGTQGRILSGVLGVQFLSAGDSLKRALQKDLKLTEKINKGIFLEDNQANSIIVDHLKTISKGDIFEGFPRTIKQAEYLSNHFDMNLISGVAILNVDKNVILDRLTQRFICSICHSPYSVRLACCDVDVIRRLDDENIEAINQRISNYENSLQDIVEFFRSYNILVENINGNNTIEMVMKDIENFYRQIVTKRE